MSALRSPAPPIGAVVLAAGAGRRLGGVAKALLDAGDGRTFLARIAATAAAAGIAPAALIVVVAAPHAAAVAAAARALGAIVVENPAPERGMASSIAVGFAALADPPATDALAGDLRAIDAAFLWPVDHPWVTVATLRALIAAGEGVPVHAGRGGHPPLIGRAHFAALAAAGDPSDGAPSDGRHPDGRHPDGVRGVLRGRLARIAVDDPGVARDVDHPRDLQERPCVA